MDHPPSPNPLALSDVSSKNVEDKPGPSSRPDAPEPPLEARPPLPPNAEQDREYGCKYCTKKFSNKQALGGHQNAHKLERATEKTAHELHDNPFGYYGGGAAYPSGYLGSYNRSHDFIDRYVFNNFPYNAAPQQHGIRIGSNARPGLPLAGNPYAPAGPVPGFNNVYPRWAAPGPRINPQFPGQGANHVQNHGNFRFMNTGASGSGSRPVYPDLSGFAAPRVRPGGNPGGGGNRDETNDQQDEDESGLDLSLKL